MEGFLFIKDPEFSEFIMNCLLFLWVLLCSKGSGEFPGLNRFFVGKTPFIRWALGFIFYSFFPVVVITFVCGLFSNDDCWQVIDVCRYYAFVGLSVVLYLFVKGEKQ